MNQRIPSTSGREAVRRPRLERSALDGFTLIELLAVMMLIAMLAALALGITNRAQRSTAIDRTRAEMAGLETAIESFKNDRGAYPTSSTLRITQRWGAERTNSWMLYTQLQPYIKPAATMILTPTGLPHLADPWTGAYNYFCTYPRLPNAAYGHEGSDVYAQDYRAIGGQVNLQTFDLFSYGPDRATYLPASGSYWNVPSLQSDDLTNWKK